MIKLVNMGLTVLGVLALVSVYALKFQAEGTASAKGALERTIAEQQNQLSMLRADWAVLNQPGYLQPIILRHAEALQLAAIDPKQFGSIDQLPMRPVVEKAPDAEALTALFEAIASGNDPIAALIEANQ